MSVNDHINVIYNLQQNSLIKIILKDWKTNMFQWCSNSGSLIQQEHLQVFGRHWWYPAECEMCFWIVREGGNHFVFVNPTIDHLGMYSWHTRARFHSLFHFQSLLLSRKVYHHGVRWSVVLSVFLVTAGQRLSFISR